LLAPLKRKTQDVFSGIFSVLRIWVLTGEHAKNIFISPFSYAWCF
jgi:hypothetical protein